MRGHGPGGGAAACRAQGLISPGGRWAGAGLGCGEARALSRLTDESTLLRRIKRRFKHT